jgi:hypothetical protein
MVLMGGAPFREALAHVLNLHGPGGLYRGVLWNLPVVTLGKVPAPRQSPPAAAPLLASVLSRSRRAARHVFLRQGVARRREAGRRGLARVRPGVPGELPGGRPRRQPDRQRPLEAGVSGEDGGGEGAKTAADFRFPSPRSRTCSGATWTPPRTSGRPTASEAFTGDAVSVPRTAPRESVARS